MWLMDDWRDCVRYVSLLLFNSAQATNGILQNSHRTGGHSSYSVRLWKPPAKLRPIVHLRRRNKACGNGRRSVCTVTGRLRYRSLIANWGKRLPFVASFLTLKPTKLHTRSAWEVSVHFEYGKNRSRGLDVIWQPVRRDLTPHPWVVTLPWG